MTTDGILHAIDVATAAMTDQVAATDRTLLEATTPCSEWDAKALIEHTLGTCNFLTGVAGGTPAEVDLWSGDPAAAFSESASAAASAWRARGLDGTVDLGGNEMPAAMVGAILALDVYLHAWDLSVATGSPLTLDDDVCETLLSVTAPAIDGSRPGGGFGPVIEVPDDAPAADRLIAYSGRVLTTA